MCTTATVDANEGWTFTNAEQANTETEHDNNWGIPANATTMDKWNAPPPAPSPHCPLGDSPAPTTMPLYTRPPATTITVALTAR